MNTPENLSTFAERTRRCPICGLEIDVRKIIDHKCYPAELLVTAKVTTPRGVVKPNIKATNKKIPRLETPQLVSNKSRFERMLARENAKAEKRIAKRKLHTQYNKVKQHAT